MDGFSAASKRKFQPEEHKWFLCYEDERGNNDNHADEDRVDLVAHADAFAATGDHGIAALVPRDAGRARCC